MSKQEKQIIVRIERGGRLTLKDVMRRIREIEAANPDVDVFFDGDEYAICSRPKRKESHSQEMKH